MEKDLCHDGDCPNNGAYARYCGHFKIDPSKRNKIATFSKKREKINRKDYAPAVKKFLAENTLCVIKMEGCKKKAVTVHHQMGRTTIKDLLDTKFWKASCVPCNNAIEANDKEAREAGNKISKHTPNYSRFDNQFSPNK